MVSWTCLTMGQVFILWSDGTKPLPDPLLTSRQYAPLWLLSIQVMTYIDDENKFEWIIFKMSPGFIELKRSIGKSLVCANFTDTHRRQFYWIYNGYFSLKSKHVNKSHLSVNRFIVNKSWRLFQMSWLFVLNKLSSVRSKVMHISG